MDDKIDQYFNKLSEAKGEEKIALLKEFARFVADIEAGGKLKDFDANAIHERAGGLIMSAMSQADLENDEVLSEAYDLANLLDVPPPHDAGIDREMSWKKILEIIENYNFHKGEE